MSAHLKLLQEETSEKCVTWLGSMNQSRAQVFLWSGKWMADLNQVPVYHIPNKALRALEKSALFISNSYFSFYFCVPPALMWA